MQKQGWAGMGVNHPGPFLVAMKYLRRLVADARPYTERRRPKKER